MLFTSALADSVDPYGTLLDQHFTTESSTPDNNAPPKPLTTAESKIANLEEALKAETRQLAEGTSVPPPPPAEIKITFEGVKIAAFVFLVGVLAFRWLVKTLDKRINEMANSSQLAADLATKISADEQAFAEFIQSFQGGPAETGEESSEAAKIFREKALPILEELRFRLHKIEDTADLSSRKPLLAALQKDLRPLKGESGTAELLPVWQMVTAIEALVQQLIKDDEGITSSALRTIGGGLKVLEALCVPGIKPDLLTNPPFRLLAVDDDLISRQAVACSLKKALNKPDVASNGEEALALVAQKTYDVIFLDVQMPGMDGFELCTRIHQLPLNQNTPVVFVTGQSDFEARTRSTESGGNDLIGKPFLTFEIAVKALSLAIPGRLAEATRVAQDKETNGNKTVVPLAGENNGSRNGHYKSHNGARNGELSDLIATVHDARANGTTSPPVVQSDVKAADSPDDPVRATLATASNQLPELRALAQDILNCTSEDARMAMLTNLCARLHSLIPTGDLLKDHPLTRLGLALEGLLKKLLESPKNCTISALLTAADAISLLSELCAPGVRCDLVTNPPIHIMVVDDDPVARRAISFALHLKFEKPETMESGDAAVALATRTPFDVIFMDVQMPGLDGFTACARIRETACNQTTPIVFVTAHGDLTTRTQSKYSGGNDLVGKPILTAEINLKALAFALRGRIQKINVARNVIPLAQGENVSRRRRARSEKQARRQGLAK